MKNLALCKVLLTSKGYLYKLDNIEVEKETEKTIFTKNYKQKKFLKDSVGKIKSHFKNDVRSSVAVVSFYCLCYEEDIEKTLIALKMNVVNKVEELKEGINGLVEGLKIERNEN